jgi:trimeric autotransporter adhesin
VTYRFKTDPTGDRHYGLIAEEVDKIYPDLVIRDDAGNIEGVRYDELAPILLGEIQQQKRRIDEQTAKIEELRQQFAKLEELNRSLQVALMRSQAGGLQVAVH